MKKSILRKTMAGLTGLLVLSYLVLFGINSRHQALMENQTLTTNAKRTIAIFGATGTIGDGILKASMNDPDVETIRVVTRRPTLRIEQGVNAGKVEMILHKDYLDYSAIRDQFADVDAVYWAIGLSAVGLDQPTYREIHTDFPVQMISEWRSISEKDDTSFHYISGSGASADSRMMWAKEKVHAERTIKALAVGTGLRTFSYRPAFIKPTETEVHLGHKILYALFAPIGSAVSAESIGEGLLEVSARSSDLDAGAIFENRDIIGLSKAYQRRVNAQGET